MNTEELRNEIHRAVTDPIRQAEECLGVAEAIGDGSGRINQTWRRNLFGHIQLSEVDRCVLNLSKLFDSPPKKFPTRSINSVLKLLDEKADSLRIVQRDSIERFLVERSVAEPEKMSYAELTRCFVKEFKVRLEHADPKGESVIQVLDRIKYRRDKQIAHNENLDEAEVVRASWDDLRLVLGVGQQFLSLVGPAYMDFHFASNDGTYMLSKDHQELGRQMTKVLEDLGRKIK
jgi:hypothetical protein